MANGIFLHDELGLSTLISDVKNEISLYKGNVSALERLITSMEGSSDWVDESLKASYIDTAKGYITSYKNYAIGLEKYIECLSNKSNNIVEHESKFS